MTKKQHILSSIVFLIVSGVVFFTCYSKLGETTLAIRPYIMPAVTSGLMTALCVLRLIIGLRMPADEVEKEKKKLIEIPAKSLIAMALVLVCALATKSVGFILTTFVYMMADVRAQGREEELAADGRHLAGHVRRHLLPVLNCFAG